MDYVPANDKREVIAPQTLIVGDYFNQLLAQPQSGLPSAFIIYHFAAPVKGFFGDLGDFL